MTVEEKTHFISNRPVANIFPTNKAGRRDWNKIVPMHELIAFPTGNRRTGALPRSPASTWASGYCIHDADGESPGNALSQFDASRSVMSSRGMLCDMDGNGKAIRARVGPGTGNKSVFGLRCGSERILGCWRHVQDALEEILAITWLWSRLRKNLAHFLRCKHLSPFTFA